MSLNKEHMAFWFSLKAPTLRLPKAFRVSDIILQGWWVLIPSLTECEGRCEETGPRRWGAELSILWVPRQRKHCRLGPGLWLGEGLSQPLLTVASPLLFGRKHAPPGLHSTHLNNTSLVREWNQTSNFLLPRYLFGFSHCSLKCFPKAICRKDPIPPYPLSHPIPPYSLSHPIPPYPYPTLFHPTPYSITPMWTSGRWPVHIQDLSLEDGGAVRTRVTTFASRQQNGHRTTSSAVTAANLAPAQPLHSLNSPGLSSPCLA